MVLLRLEAATSRLEDMVPNMSDPSTALNGSQPGQVQRLSTSRATEPSGGAIATSQKQHEALPPAIDDFDAMINAEVKTFVNMSEEIGGLVAEQVLILFENTKQERYPMLTVHRLLQSFVLLLRSGNSSSSLLRRRNRISNHLLTWKF